MNDEIKTILNYLELYKNLEEGLLSAKDKKMLLDYITNLQQENERLKEIWEDTRTFIKDNKRLMMNKNGYDVYEDYKSRIEKAVEYMNNTFDITSIKDMFDIMNKLEDILNGRSDE